MATGPSETTGARLSIVRVRVGEARVEATVRLAPGTRFGTATVPGLADRVLSAFPGIVRHRCECGSPHGIIAELANTELPHVLEHVALELMVLAGSPRGIEGETRWDFSADGHGVFRVTLDYDDDLVALSALCEAAAIVNLLVGQPGVSIDARSAIARVKGARRRARSCSGAPVRSLTSASTDAARYTDL